jgi:hypothetical protein
MEEILMKRLAVVLAAAALGTGCHSSATPRAPVTPVGTVDFAWSFVRVKADNSTARPYGCALAGIDNVVVSFSTGDVQVPCADQVGDGAGITNVVAGTQSVVVTGRRGAVALYTAQTNVTVLANDVTPVNIQVFGIPDDLDIFAHFMNRFGTLEAWPTCGGPGGAGVSTLSYSIVDFANTVVASGTVSCTDPAGLSFRGSAALDRDNYIIRMQGFPPSSQTETFDSATTALNPACDGQAFDHFGPSTGNAAWDVLLYDTTPNTTICP